MFLFRWLVQVLTHQRVLVSLAGTGPNRNEDGIGGDCQFSQSTGMCTDGNILFVIDSGSRNDRIVTSLSALQKHLSALSKLYNAFSVHSSIEEFLEPSLSEAKALLEF